MIPRYNCPECGIEYPENWCGEHKHASWCSQQINPPIKFYTQADIDKAYKQGQKSAFLEAEELIKKELNRQLVVETKKVDGAKCPPEYAQAMQSYYAVNLLNNIIFNFDKQAETWRKV